MTLVGLLPPICDNGNMLVDGGYGEWEPLARLTSRSILPFHSGQLAGKFAVARRLAEILTRNVQGICYVGSGRERSNRFRCWLGASLPLPVRRWGGPLTRRAVDR